MMIKYQYFSCLLRRVHWLRSTEVLYPFLPGPERLALQLGGGEIGMGI
jgi:hypothetical protein